jgi:hypothetical protein
MLLVQLGTLPWHLPSPVTLSLETLTSIDRKGAGHSIGEMAMPRPGSVAVIWLPVQPVFVLRLMLRFGRDQVGVVLGPLHDGDTLPLMGGFVPLGCRNVVRPPGCIRERHHRDDHGVGPESRHTPSLTRPAGVFVRVD